MYHSGVDNVIVLRITGEGMRGKTRISVMNSVSCNSMQGCKHTLL